MKKINFVALCAALNCFMFMLAFAAEPASNKVQIAVYNHDYAPFTGYTVHFKESDGKTQPVDSFTATRVPPVGITTVGNVSMRPFTQIVLQGEGNTIPCEGPQFAPTQGKFMIQVNCEFCSPRGAPACQLKSLEPKSE